MRITTIIPTLAEYARREQLLRAIESIHCASVSPVRIIVVVNGSRFDASLVDQLNARSDLEVIQVDEGSQTNAQLVGRRHVVTEFFSFLDDDDEYLPGALDVRASLLDGEPAAAVAVTNGYVRSGAGERPLYARMAKVGSNPLLELFQENWMHNCNHLFRTASVGIDYFEGAPAVLEWTWLAFRLAMDAKVVVASPAFTFRYNDTPGSLSKTSKFLASRVALYDSMLASRPPADVAAVIRRRRSSAWHDVSVSELKSGETLRAFAAHARSMTCHWSGLKYASYSRRLVLNRMRRIDFPSGNLGA